MSREASKLLLETALSISGELDTTLAAIEPLCAKDDFSAYKLMVGKVMGEALAEIIVPIISEYPDLTPPGLKLR